MGGAVGLKGTDGRKTLRDAVRKGAKPVSLERGLRFLEEVQRRSQGIEFLTAPGNMGASIAAAKYSRGTRSSSQHSCRSCGDRCLLSNSSRRFAESSLFSFNAESDLLRELWEAFRSHDERESIFPSKIDLAAPRI